MATVSVDIVVTDKTVSANPISGVSVHVYNEAGSTLITSTITDVDGLAAFLLPDETTYQVRLYKSQVVFQNPVYIEVLPDPEINQFDVKGEPFVAPVATDPRLCVASGYFRRGDGGPARNHDIHFIARFNPLVLDGSAVIQERITIRTDQYGYGQVTLIRNGQYDVTMQGLEDMRGTITVPDLSSCVLPHLLFPVVEAASFDPSGAQTISVGGEVQLEPTVVASSGEVLDGTAIEDVSWSVADPSIVALNVTPTHLVLRGVAPGTTTLLAKRLDNSIIRIPNTEISGLPVTINVV